MADKIHEISVMDGDAMTLFEPGMRVVVSSGTITMTGRLRVWMARKLFSWAERLNRG